MISQNNGANPTPLRLALEELGTAFKNGTTEEQGIVLMATHKLLPKQTLSQVHDILLHGNYDLQA